MAFLQERDVNKNPILEDLLDELMSIGGEKLKNIFDRVMEKFPTLSKVELLFDYSFDELIGLLEIGEENCGVVKK